MSSVQVHGRVVDEQTRCAHYASELDVVAIQFFCCRRWYPCLRCHNEAESHEIVVWPREQRGRRALLCGVCQSTLSIADYLVADSCLVCAARFNPGCSLHHHVYFEM